jgi:prepilin-type processing-associated H-X9-DG protein
MLKLQMAKLADKGKNIQNQARRLPNCALVPSGRTKRRWHGLNRNDAMKEDRHAPPVASLSASPPASITRTDLHPLRHWRWAGLLALIVLGCAVTLALQHVQILQVSQAVKTLLPVAQEESNPAETGGPTQDKQTAPATLTEAEEMNQLRDKIDRIRAEIAQLNEVRSQNEQLRTQLATPPVNTNLAADQTAMQAPKERALVVACLNNMKQMALAVRIWAEDNNNIGPPDIVSMSNELNTPKVLVCPADGRQPAADWTSYTAANCSYDFLAPSANMLEGNRVMFRCPIHGNYVFCDGSVQRLSPEGAASALVQHDGKLYRDMKDP